MLQLLFFILIIPFFAILAIVFTLIAHISHTFRRSKQPKQTTNTRTKQNRHANIKQSIKQQGEYVDYEEID